MKVSISKSKNKTIFYISKSLWINGKSTTKTVEKLGSLEEVREKAGGMDPYEWAKQYAAGLTKPEQHPLPPCLRQNYVPCVKAKNTRGSGAFS